MIPAPLRWRYWKDLFLRRQMEEDLDEEVRAHLALEIQRRIDQGRSPLEARRQALRDLGSLAYVKEATRQAWAWTLLAQLAQDVQYALRGFARNPGFTAAALLTLALGIGATTIVFGVVDGVLLRPLPFEEPGRLLTLQERTDQATQYGDLWAFAYPNFLDVRTESRTLEAAAWRYRYGTVSGPGEAEYVSGREVSANFLSVLGVGLLEGRGFLPAEDRPDGEPVAVIGYGLRQSQFGDASPVLGEKIVFDGAPYTVVGVLRPGFRWLDETQLLLAIGQNPAAELQNRAAHPGLGVVARMEGGATLDQARSELTRIGRRLAEAHPASNEGRTFVAEPLRPDVGNAASTLWLLLGAVGLVLLIGCVNVASLLLARSVSRERETAMKAALGAGRGRLIRQCLTESGVLGIAGGGLGVVLAHAGIRPFMALWPGSLPRAETVQIDWRVLLFALGASMLASLLFGLLPALRVPARDLERTLRAGSPTTGSTRRMHSVFVVSEIALAVVLLVSAGVLGKTLLRLSALDPGLRPDHLLVTRMALSPSTLADPDRTRAAWDEVLRRAREIPGVEAIAALDTVPMRNGNNQLAYWPDPNLPPPDELPLALATSVTPDYFKVAGIPLLRGRGFDDGDRLETEPVVVIDEVLARRAYEEEDPVGRRLWVPGAGTGPLRVVGVVPHVRHWGLAEDDEARVRAQFYYPFAQVPDPLVRRWSELMSIAVRTSIEPRAVVTSLRRALRGGAGDQVLYEVRTMDQLVDGSLSRQRFLLLLFSAAAALALLLASIGVYGVLSYATRQRTRELALRVALGSSSRGLVRMVMGQTCRLLAVGLGMGLSAAWGAQRLIVRLVPGVEGSDPWTILFMLTILIGAALAASYPVAVRAGRVDPMGALRTD